MYTLVRRHGERAEPWTARPGESVPFDDTLASYSALVAGAADAVPAEALRYILRPKGGHF